MRTVAVIGPQIAGYETALGPLLERAGALAGLSGPELSERLVGGLGLDVLVRQLVAATAATINHFGVVAIYAAFLLVDQQFFDRKLRALQPDPVRRAETAPARRPCHRSIQAYLLIMTFVSALTSLLSYAVMRLTGVDYASFLATMIFFLNFIPTIGSILGTVIPAGFALLQFQALRADAPRPRRDRPRAVRDGQHPPAADVRDAAQRQPRRHHFRPVLLGRALGSHRHVRGHAAYGDPW